MSDDKDAKFFELREEGKTYLSKVTLNICVSLTLYSKALNERF